MADGKSFDFVDINPGLSGMAFAAEAEGGVCVGVIGVKPRDFTMYEEFFGRGAAAAPITTADIVLVSLPFSMFVRTQNCDPAVSDLIDEAHSISEEARIIAKKSTPVLFRVSWAAARRMHIEAEEYRSAVAVRFDSRKWEVTSAVSDDGNDMFVCAIPRPRWTGQDPLPSTFPVAARARSGLNPQESLVSMGYPEKFALRHADVASNLVEGAVVISNARAAIVGALGSVR